MDYNKTTLCLYCTDIKLQIAWVPLKEVPEKPVKKTTIALISLANKFKDSKASKQLLFITRG